MQNSGNTTANNNEIENSPEKLIDSLNDSKNENNNNNIDLSPQQKLYYREPKFYTTRDDEISASTRRASEQHLSTRVSNSYFATDSFVTHSTSCDQSINFVPVSLVLAGDGPPWGFSLKGGKEHEKPITVTK